MLVLKICYLNYDEGYVEIGQARSLKEAKEIIYNHHKKEMEKFCRKYDINNVKTLRMYDNNEDQIDINNANDLDIVIDDLPKDIDLTTLFYDEQVVLEECEYFKEHPEDCDDEWTLEDAIENNLHSYESSYNLTIVD